MGIWRGRACGRVVFEFFELAVFLIVCQTLLIFCPATGEGAAPSELLGYRLLELPL